MGLDRRVQVRCPTGAGRRHKRTCLMSATFVSPLKANPHRGLEEAALGVGTPRLSAVGRCRKTPIDQASSQGKWPISRGAQGLYEPSWWPKTVDEVQQGGKFMDTPKGQGGFSELQRGPASSSSLPGPSTRGRTSIAIRTGPALSGRCTGSPLRAAKCGDSFFFVVAQHE